MINWCNTMKETYFGRYVRVLFKLNLKKNKQTRIIKMFFLLQSVDQFEAAVSLVTNHRLMKYYKIFVLTGFTHAAAAALSANAVSLNFLLNVLSVLISRNIDANPFGFSFISSIFLGFLVYASFLVIVRLYRRKVKSCVWLLVL